MRDSRDRAVLSRGNYARRLEHFLGLICALKITFATGNSGKRKRGK